MKTEISFFLFLKSQMATATATYLTILLNYELCGNTTKNPNWIVQSLKLLWIDVGQKNVFTTRAADILKQITMSLWFYLNTRKCYARMINHWPTINNILWFYLFIRSFTLQVLIINIDTRKFAERHVYTVYSFVMKII